MATSLKLDIDDTEFIKKLEVAMNKNPNILQQVLTKAMEQFDKISKEVALNGGQGLGRKSGKTYQTGFKRFRKNTKKYASAVFFSPIANLFTGNNPAVGFKKVMILRITERAFRKSGVLDKILREEVERVYNG